MKKLIIIPAYNEVDSIENVIKEITEFAPGYDYIVVNDCSVDGTKEKLKNKNINYLDMVVNLGIGGAVQGGYKYAFENGYDIAIQMDGDGQHDCRFLVALTEVLEKNEADISIGSRFIEKNGFQSNAIRRIGIRFLSKLINILTNYDIKDVTSGFRAVNKDIIKAYASNYPHDYPEPEAIVMASNYGARIVEVPVIMRERESGKSSINALRSVYYMIKVSLAIIIEKARGKGNSANDNK